VTLECFLIMIETTVTLNVPELNILMAAMNSLSLADEKRLAEDYGSVPALYNKLYGAWEQCDGPQTDTRRILEGSY